MRHVPLERDINIAVNGCFGFAPSTQKGPFTAMLISCSRGTYLISYQKGIVIPPESTELSLPVTRNSQGSAQRCCETRRHCFKQHTE